MSQDKLLKDQLRTMISKARRSLAAAKRQIEDGDYDFASSRAYYIKRIIEKDANFKGMILFFDTSVIVKYFHSKNGTEAFRNGIDKYNIIMENRIK